MDGQHLKLVNFFLYTYMDFVFRNNFQMPNPKKIFFPFFEM